MTTEIVVPLVLRGGNEAAYNCREPEILDEGPTGTGKTLMWLNLINNLAWDFPGFHGLIARKTAVTLTTTCLVTFNQEVLKPGDGVNFFGGSKDRPAAYQYPNGSTIVVGGFDKGADGGPSKILSTQYHFAYVNELIELSLEDLETLKTRVRPHGEPLTSPRDGYVFQDYRIGADCNPSNERSWVLQRCNAGVMRHFKSRLQDNPLYFNADETPTEAGKKYLENISTLTGTRYQRLVLGEWVGMENAIYPQLDPSVQLVSLSAEMQRLPFSWVPGRSASGADYGTVHLSAVVGLSESSTGHIWVRKCHAMSGGNLKEIEDSARGIGMAIKSNRGKTDPNQAVLAQRLGWQTAKMGPGTRKQRIAIITSWLDADLLRFDADEPEVRDLFDEALSYRYETRETDTMIEDVVVRKDDNRVSAMEYAAEAKETVAVFPTPDYRGIPYGRAPRAVETQAGRRLAAEAARVGTGRVARHA